MFIKIIGNYNTVVVIVIKKPSILQEIMIDDCIWGYSLQICDNKSKHESTPK